ncbi:BNR/Asp-box repeat protein [Planctomycetes bacterium Poly30]|uniref:BNR/Asp-box repeat protein n=2 Tax=Saltatorellus ferox TaxID=2528018 RepID=A0A518EY82_9BACT|nr:BNR/Asp-box repeat protein [Planctomycetes bacterium Poly30]
MLLLATALILPQAATVRDLLDADGDGHVNRYEAAAAALAWADARAATDPAPASTAPERAEAERQAAARQGFRARDTDGNGFLEPKEIEAPMIELYGWQMFDSSADRRLDPEEYVAFDGACRSAAVFEVTKNVVSMRGNLHASTPGRFLEVLLEHRAVDELVLEFEGPRAVPEVTRQVADLIQRSGILVRVPRGGTVHRSGMELLQAAQRRIIEPGANLRRAVAAGERPTSMWLTEDEIHDLGLRTETEGLVLMQTGTRSSFRGLAAVSHEIAWATGSGATVVKTTDAGRSWSNVAPASIAGLDVRDVFAISADIAWIMTAGPGNSSRILYTEDGGATWTEQHRETAPEAFLDGLDAWDGDHLIAYGDPMEDGRFRVLLSNDGGVTWTPSETGPVALETGEASFAASGTGLRTLGGLRAWIVTGGTKSTARVFRSEDSGRTWTPADTPVAAKGAGAGAFSVSFREDGTGVIVGGDFLDREAGGVDNAAYSVDFGKTWKSPDVGPRGQRAGSVALGNGWFIATGQTGTDISRDGGKTWRPFSSEGFHCVDAALLDGAIWFAGPNGRVARLR